MTGPEFTISLKSALSRAGAILLALLPLAGVLPSAVWASDRTIAPPTCVSIENAVKNCPGRSAEGAVQNANARRAEALAMLQEAEKKAGKKLEPGEAQGEPEMFNFFDAEVKRLAMNGAYLKEIRPQLTSPAEGSDPLRLVSRLTIQAVDVVQEANFWCEAVGMQIYSDTPTGGKVVAFGNPGVLKGDEGGFFSVLIEPKAAGSAKASAKPGGLRLSFVQVATPALIRISKVLANGGELIDGYGYYDLRSPAGVEIRAYVEDRRDPVEFVAVVPATEDGFKDAAKEIEGLGFRSRGKYKLVNEYNQEYMPVLPDGNRLYTSGDPTRSVQLVLLPKVKPKEQSFLNSLRDSLPAGLGTVQNEKGSLEVDVMEQEEGPMSPVSDIGPASLFITGAGKATGSSSGAADANALRVELKPVQ